MEIEINEKTTTADLEQIIKYFRQPIYGSPFGIKGRMNRKAYFLYSFLYAFFISFIPTFFLTLLSSLLFKLKIIDVQRVMLFPMYATLLTYPLSFWICSMLTIKRLHDLNLSGLWYSIWCIWALIYTPIWLLPLHFLGISILPKGLFYLYLENMDRISTILGWYFVVLLILNVILLCKRGTFGINKYGKDPLGPLSEETKEQLAA